MTQVLIFSIIGFILSACLLVQACIKLTEKESYSWVFPLVISSMLLIFSFINMILMTDEVHAPHAKDVIYGSAVYQENYHVINSDTIKTYNIVWKQ